MFAQTCTKLQKLAVPRQNSVQDNGPVIVLFLLSCMHDVVCDWRRNRYTTWLAATVK